MTERELAVRRGIMRVFAERGRPPAVAFDSILRSLADQHAIVLDERGTILMAHPFAAPGGAARVDSDGRTWWGSCAWDGLGIVAALGLRQATVTNNGVTVRVEDGEPQDHPVFHVAVPARRWWDDIVHT